MISIVNSASSEVLKIWIPAGVWRLKLIRILVRGMMLRLESNEEIASKRRRKYRDADGRIEVKIGPDTCDGYYFEDRERGIELTESLSPSRMQ
jgi:hypothetical protein